MWNNSRHLGLNNWLMPYGQPQILEPGGGHEFKVIQPGWLVMVKGQDDLLINCCLILQYIWLMNIHIHLWIYRCGKKTWKNIICRFFVQGCIGIPHFLVCLTQGNPVIFRVTRLDRHPRLEHRCKDVRGDRCSWQLGSCRLLFRSLRSLSLDHFVGKPWIFRCSISTLVYVQ